MPVTRLVHFKALGYAPVNIKTAPVLPNEVFALADSGAEVVTFRPLGRRRADRTVKKVQATNRFSWIKSRHVVAYGLATDSPLAPLILWDIAHAAEVGTVISVLGDTPTSSYLSRDYFKSGLELSEQVGDRIVFRKTAPLPAEIDAGVDAWTFGIPVGPEDATLLNMVVKRILDLRIKTKEILLCGRPGENFAYFDQVRIVGEDITAPPVQICAKKNRLAQEASHPNLCIIHDRVFLPSNFDEVVNQFGDHFPLTTLQSVFFDDKYNFVPRRYSDVGISHRVRGQSTRGVMRDDIVEQPSEFAPSVLALTELSGFHAANALRYNMSTYPTGSMYLCKKSVWRACPQNENLHWIEFEDLEHAFRASDMGIPSRVNPYGITQSLVSRPLLSRVTGTFIENAKGKAMRVRAWSEALPIPRKPAIKLTRDRALDAMNLFAHKYVPEKIRVEVPTVAVERSTRRISSVIDILSRARVPVQADALRRFIADFEKLMVFDQLPFSWTERAVHRFLMDHAEAVQTFVLENDVLLNHLASRPKGEIFVRNLKDYFQLRTLRLRLGTLVSAICLYRRRRDVLFLKGGPLFYFRALHKTTPFSDL
ncbi:hypothetical protein PQQ63_26990 [Paraburkholderia metrosideri]|uniref:Uncharacterized protein n=1 Tax=Paraburkholderia metrosideri TaxID=580937 RepID=A0ABW9DZL4_9BURK